MSSFRAVSPRMNLLTRVASGQVTFSTNSANSLFPVARLSDGIPSRACIAAAAGSIAIDVDGDLLQGYGAMESTFAGGFAGGWSDGSTGGGVGADETSITHGGSHAQKLTAASGSQVARGYRDILVQAGESIPIEAWLRGDGTATVYARVQDLTTFKWWDGSAWQSSVSSWGSRSSAASYAKSTSTIVVDSATNLRSGISTLRVSFVVDGSVATGSGYVDDVAMWPAVDFVSVHGHNIPLGATVDLLSSTSSGFGAPTTEASAIAVYHPSFYKILSAAHTNRYTRFKVTDSAAVAALYLGQLVLGATITMTAAPDYPISTRRRTDHDRAVTRYGHQHVSAVTTTPAREVTLPFGTRTAAEFREIRDRLYLAAVGDLHSLVVIPRDDDAEGCYFGRLDGALDDDLAVLDYRGRLALRVQEHPFPVVV